MICIYSDSNSSNYGGVEVLVTRFAQYLRDKSIPFIVVEPGSTRLALELKENETVDPRELDKYAGKISHVFFPNMSWLRKESIDWPAFGDVSFTGMVVHPNEPFRSFFPYSGKILNVFGYNAARQFGRIFNDHYRYVESIFQLTSSSKGLICMDGATVRALNYFYPELSMQPTVIPIPSPVSSANEQRKICIQNVSRGNEISIGYFGRIDDFKYSALKPLLNVQLRQASKRFKVNLHMVADGLLIKKVSKLCKRINVSCHMHGFLPNLLARNLLLEKTDFAVAMGTAALDIAATGHPCLIIDPALKRGTPYQKKFRFVHEIIDFTLGEYRDFPDYREGIRTFCDAIDLILEKNDLGFLGQKYINQAHNPDKVFSEILKCIQNSSVEIRHVACIVHKINKSFRTLRLKIK